MYRYKKIQEHIKNLEEEDNRIQLAMDDAYADYFKSPEKEEISNFLDKLREQRKEVNIHLRVNRENLRFASGDFEFSLEKHFEEDNEYCINMWLNDKNIIEFHKWLSSMMKEVQ